MRPPRELDPVEIRVLGSLLEKQQATPEYYPLTVNALLAACNQKSNREPVMSLTEGDVRAALNRLRDDVLVWSSSGARVERWEHNLDRRLELDAGSRAVLTVLMLRGPQTTGELRSRTERLHPFDTPREVEEVLRRLAAGPEALVAELGRRPGQKESRWAHLLAGTLHEPVAEERPRTAAAGGLGERVAQLEAEVAALAEALEALRAHLDDGR